MRQVMLFTGALVLCVGATAHGATITLVDGSACTGIVDPGSTAEELLFREGTPRCYLVHKLPWDRVQGAADDGLTLTGVEFRKRWLAYAAQLAALRAELTRIAVEQQRQVEAAAARATDGRGLTGRQIELAELQSRARVHEGEVAALLAHAKWCAGNGYRSYSRAAYVTVLQLDPTNAEAAAAVGLEAARTPSPEPEQRPAAKPDRPTEAPALVTHIRTQTTFANWDSDDAVDGLTVRLTPRDARGDTVPVDGWLDAELIGVRIRPRMSMHSFVRLGSWRVRVRRSDFGPGGAVVRLPYDDSKSITVGERVRPYAKLRVNLHVAGQGGFSAQEPDVRLRPFDALGDERFHFGPGGFSPSP